MSLYESRINLDVLADACRGRPSIMKNCEIFAQITWTRQDIRQLLEDHDLDNMEEAVDRFLERLDLRRFEEACIEDGWGRRSWLVIQ